MVLKPFVIFLKKFFQHKLVVLFIAGFLLGYILVSLGFYTFLMVVRIDEKTGELKEPTILDAFNPFSPMSPVLWSSLEEKYGQ